MTVSRLARFFPLWQRVESDTPMPVKRRMSDHEMKSVPLVFILATVSKEHPLISSLRRHSPCDVVLRCCTRLHG
jgi:hypothetical protein